MSRLPLFVLFILLFDSAEMCVFPHIFLFIVIIKMGYSRSSISFIFCYFTSIIMSINTSKLTGIYHGTVSSDSRAIAWQPRGHGFEPHSVQLFICDYKAPEHVSRFWRDIRTISPDMNSAEHFYCKTLF